MNLFKLLVTMSMIFLAIAFPSTAQDDSKVISLENASQLTLLASLGHGQLLNYDYSGDGKYLVVATDHGVWLHNAEAPDYPLVYPTPIPFPSFIASINADASLIATRAFKPNKGFELILWDIATWSEYAVLPVEYTESVFDFSPIDKTLLVTAGQGTNIVLWDVETVSPKTIIEGEFRSALLEFNSDGNLLVSRSGGLDMTVWDIENERKLWSVVHDDTDRKEIHEHDGGYPYARFSPDGTQILSSSGSRFYLWNSETGEPLLEHEAPDSFRGITEIVFSPDGRFIDYADGISMYWRYDLENDLDQEVPPNYFLGMPFATPNVGYLGDLITFALSPDSKTMLVLSSNGSIHILDTKTGQYQTTIKVNDYVYEISFTPDGKYFLTKGSSIILWDAVTRQPIKRTGFDTPTDLYSGSVISPDGTTVAYTYSTKQQGEQEELRFFSLPGMMPLDFAWPDDNRFTSRPISFTSDGKYLLTHTNNASSIEPDIVRLWDWQTGKIVMEYAENTISVSMTPDSRYIVFEKDYRIELVEITSGQRWGIDMPNFWPDTAFTPDMSILATITNHELRLYDMASHTLLEQFTLPIPYSITDLAFSPDGSRLMLMGNNNYIEVWGIE